MARPPRMQRAGAWYHITARGIERRTIFGNAREHAHFCELLAEMISRFKVALHAYVLMGNHYHLLLETSQGNLSRAMQWLNVSYSVWFNRRHERCGPLFQGRFKAVVFDPQEAALRLSQYVHLNPVRIGSLALDKHTQQASRSGLSAKPSADLIATRLALLRKHRWSSYGAYVGSRVAPDWLTTEVVLGYLGNKHQDRPRAYRDYVERAIREGIALRPWDELVEQVALGSEAFLKKVREHWRGSPRESPGLKRLIGQPTWPAAVRVVEQLRGEPWERFRDRYGDWARDLALYLGQRRCGMSLKQLGELSGGIDYASVCCAIKRFEAKARRAKVYRKLLNTALEKLK